MTVFVNPAKFGRIDPADWRQYPAHYTQSIWPEKLPSKPANYGSNQFSGRTHPDIIKTALMRYTRPSDLVWDCMAGSGTTIDVCKELGNSCIASDITPTRPDIRQVDCTQWHPSVSVDLVICHPPYLDIVDYGDGVLSTPDLDVYLDKMSMVFHHIRSCLNLWRVLVLIVGVVYRDGQMVCLDYHLQHLLPDFRLLGRVVRPFGETKGGATSGKRNENLWIYRRLKYGIWALDQDVVLFLQKVKK